MTLTTETKENISSDGINVDVVTADPIPAPAADDQKAPPAATDETAEPAAETTEQQEAHKQSKFQRRLQRQRDARVAAETELRLTKERLASLEAQSKQPQETGEPQRNGIDPATGEEYTYEAYLRAVAKHDAKQGVAQALKADREANQGKERQQQAVQGQEKLEQQWTERENAFMSETKGYAEAVTPFVEEDLEQFSDPARMAIIESEVGPQLLHHLATNPEVVERIADLSPLRQVAELGKLEVNLTKPVTKKASNAPAPITPVKPGASASQGFSENMSDTEYKAWRKGQGARWAR